MEQMHGTVKWFNDKKGYGFITGSDGVDVFVHFSKIDSNAERRTLNQGDRVRYDITQGRKGMQAENVKVV